EREPSFSPDGSQIVFSWDGEAQDNYDIYLKVVGPGAPLRLTTHPGRDFSPKWSPDGRTIAFVRVQPDEPTAVIVMPALGGGERTVARFRRTRIERVLDWSPDGKWLVAAASPDNGPPALQAISIESGETHPLTIVPK